MSYEAKLTSMGYKIEPADPLDNGRFVAAVRIGDLVFTSGQVSVWGDKVVKGKVGADVSLEQAIEAARFCTLNNLRAVKAVVGSLDHIVRVVKVLGMVNVAPGFDETPAVIHGCSDFLREVVGDAGRHARSAVGMTLPLNYAVEIEAIFEVRGGGAGAGQSAVSAAVL